jgi:hypothetical protein
MATGIDPTIPTQNVNLAALLTLVAAAANTYVSPDQDNPSCAGLNLYINITAVTTSATVTIQGKDPVSGTYYTILASTALAAAAFTRLFVFRGAPVAANVSANDQLPRTWRISVTTVGASTSMTVGGSIIE